jgi:septum formation protein
MSNSQPLLVLASTSVYRREMLAKLTLPFTRVAPDFAETAAPGEPPTAMARRFAAGKACAVASKPPHNKPTTLVIGSDQVVTVAGKILGKPGNIERARQQLALCSGQWVTYTSAICLASAGNIVALEHEDYEVQFRKLSTAAIDRYLTLEQPFDSAGSIKAEGLGISLFASTRGQDINTLYGMPLILLSRLLRERQIDPLE